MVDQGSNKLQLAPYEISFPLPDHRHSCRAFQPVVYAAGAGKVYLSDDDGKRQRSSDQMTMTDCDGMDMAQPTLCHTHASGEVQVLRLIVNIAIAALSTATIPAFAADVPLTLDYAQSLAVSGSRQLAAQDSAALSSRELAVAAGQMPDPVLKLGIDNLPVTGTDQLSLTDDFMTMRRVGVMQEITGSDKRRSRVALYERSAEKSLDEKSVTIAAIQRDTAIAWLDRYFAEQMVATVTEQVSQAQLEVQSAESAYRSGRGNQSDIFAARSALALLEDRSSEIRRRVRNAKISLVRWIGSAANAS